jgi:TrmH family RNA methyltransferase
MSRTRKGKLAEHQNARLEQFHRVIKDRGERDRTRLFYLEGMRALLQAYENDAQIEALVVAPKLLTNPIVRSVARQIRRVGVPSLEVTAETFRRLALVEAPQGIAALARQRWEPLAAVDPHRDRCWIALETVQSPGNLGSILRTSEAVGGAGLILIGRDVDPYHPAVVRASMGALFVQRFVRARPSEFAAWRRAHGCLVVGTSPRATVDYRAARYTPPVVLAMGWERQGLSPALQALCDVMVSIPMVGKGDSLNLAVVTGVMLYEILNQCHPAFARPPPANWIGGRASEYCFFPILVRVWLESARRTKQERRPRRRGGRCSGCHPRAEPRWHLRNGRKEGASRRGASFGVGSPLRALGVEGTLCDDGNRGLGRWCWAPSRRWR